MLFFRFPFTRVSTKKARVSAYILGEVELQTPLVKLQKHRDL